MHRVIRVFIAIVGSLLATLIILLIDASDLLVGLANPLRVALYVLAALIGFFLSFWQAPRLMDRMKVSFNSFTESLTSIPMVDLVLGTIGLVVGLLIANLITHPLSDFYLPHIGNAPGVIISVIIYMLLGFIGIQALLKYKEEILSGLSRFRKEGKGADAGEEGEQKKRKVRWQAADVSQESSAVPKILDTSVIIDGRIFDVIRAGFLEGPFIISSFVLTELQHIADSADTVRRERGRRGLDLVSDFRQNRQDVIVSERDFKDAKEVDIKLLKLTRELEGKIVTNDYNLNKVASVQDIPVLNVNDLANALKPVVIPGEHLTVDIIKEGKEPEQGIAYLEDGTMIVIENGKDYIGERKEGTVTSVLQTAAGKMIFVRV